MNITLTIDVAPEVLTVLRAFTHLGSGAPAPEKKSDKKQPEKRMEVVKDEQTASENTQSDSSSDNTSTTVTLEQVRAAAQIKQQAGKRDGIKALLVEYDAKNVSTLAKEHYPEFLKKVQAL